MCRAILESLALRYRQVLESLETLLGRRIDVIHIVGGGSRNQLLNQFVADATGRTVVAGTVGGDGGGQHPGAGDGRGRAVGFEGSARSGEAQLRGHGAGTALSAGWDAAYEKFRGLQA